MGETLFAKMKKRIEVEKNNMIRGQARQSSLLEEANRELSGIEESTGETLNMLDPSKGDIEQLEKLQKIIEYLEPLDEKMKQDIIEDTEAMHKIFKEEGIDI